MNARVLRKMIWLLPLLLLPVCQGCATYEFDVVQSPSESLHVTSSEMKRIRANPLEFGFQAADGRLVVWIYNNNSGPIEILGDKCTIVDPDGQSHPLPDQTIAPASFVKMILPPFRPRIEQPAPFIGIGGSFGNADGPGYIRPTGYGPPDRMDVVEGASPYYWDWDGETQVHFTLVYKLGDKTDQISFVFHRVKK